MNQKYSHGSALLSVVVLMTTISFFCLVVWRMTSYGVDTVVHKICHERAVQALYGLQEYAQLYVTYNAEPLSKYMGECELVFEHWPLKQSPYQGIIYLKPIEQGFVLECCIKERVPLMTSRCEYVQEHEKTPSIHLFAWTRIE